MKNCSLEHEEIVFDSNPCPLCSTNALIAELEGEIAHAEDEKEKLRSSIVELEDIISTIESNPCNEEERR